MDDAKLDHLIRLQEDLLETIGGSEGLIRAQLHRHERKARAFVGDRPALYLQALPLESLEWRITFPIAAKALDGQFDVGGPRSRIPNGLRLEGLDPEAEKEWRLDIHQDGYVSYIHFNRDTERKLRAADFRVIQAFGLVCDRIPIAQDLAPQLEVPYLLRLKFFNSSGFVDVSTAGSIGPPDEGPEIELPDEKRETEEPLSEVANRLSQGLKSVLSPAR